MIEAMKNLFNSKPQDVQEAIQPIKIMQNIFIEHEELCRPILHNLAVSFITYYYDASAVQGTQFGEEVSIQAEKLIENIADYFQIVLDSFRNEIVNSDKIDKMKIMRMIKFIAQKFLAKETNNPMRRSNYHRITIMGILSQLNTINLSDIHNLQSKELSLLKFGSHTLTLLLEPLNQLTAANEQVMLEVCGDETFVGNLAGFIDSIAKMLKSYSRENDHVDLGPFQVILQDLMKFTIQSFEYTQILQPLPSGEIPEWLIQTFQGVKSENDLMSELCLDSCIKIFEIFVNLPLEPEGCYNNIWNRIKLETFSPELKNKIGFDLLRDIIVICFNKLEMRETKKVVYTNQVVNYLLLLSKYGLDLIDNYVEQELTSQKLDKSVVCYRQCIKFWQMTEEQTGEDIDSIRHRLAFKMLAFVDHENPLLRYSAKNWLYTNIRYFHNILDVIYISILHDTEWTFKDEVSYAGEYPTEKVTECIKHLKNMLIVLGNNFCEYITSSKIRPKIAALLPKLGEKKLSAASNINYLDLLAVICLRYIEGHVKEDGTSFQVKNLSVKATACEFLELILSKHPLEEPIAQISFYLLDPLAHVLKTAVDHDESSILIQILSVLSVILFNSRFQNDKKFREKYFAFMQKKSFLATLIQGLSSSHLYIVIEFKDFINSLITVAAEHLLHPVLTDMVSSILQGYYELISANNARYLNRLRKSDKGSDPTKK